MSTNAVITDRVRCLGYSYMVLIRSWLILLSKNWCGQSYIASTCMCSGTKVEGISGNSYKIRMMHIDTLALILLAMHTLFCLMTTAGTIMIVA